jgi:hypothetical protein
LNEAHDDYCYDVSTGFVGRKLSRQTFAQAIITSELSFLKKKNSTQTEELVLYQASIGAPNDAEAGSARRRGLLWTGMGGVHSATLFLLACIIIVVLIPHH